MRRGNKLRPTPIRIQNDPYGDEREDHGPVEVRSLLHPLGLGGRMGSKSAPLMRRNNGLFNAMGETDCYERWHCPGTLDNYWVICCRSNVIDAVCSRYIGGQSVVGKGRRQLASEWNRRATVAITHRAIVAISFRQGLPPLPRAAAQTTNSASARSDIAADAA